MMATDREHLEAVLGATTALNLAIRAAAQDGVVTSTSLVKRPADGLGERFAQVVTRVMRPVRQGR
jgi:hypothetical protein